jgi:hypothetical protein
MKCPVCGKETPSNKSHCQECGERLKAEFRNCSNGHQFSSSVCPYCPPEGSPGSVATIAESAHVESFASSEAETVIEGPAKPNYSPQNDGTVIIKPTGTAGSGGPILAPLGEQASPFGRKIVGFLVTYDLNPMGTVFNLYEGRNIIGRVAPANVLIQSGTVSDKHAIILFRDEKFYLSDELSTNGTHVNGESIDERIKISDRDEVRFGEIKTKFIVI